MQGLSAESARDLAMRLAGATHSRRVYGTNGPIWERTLTALCDQIRQHLDVDKLNEVTFALLGDGIAVCGVPIHAPPDAVIRFIGQLKQRNIEIVSFAPGVLASEIETLLAFVGADAADVAAINAETWLRERGAENVRIKHVRLTKGPNMDSFRDVYRRGVQGLDGEFRHALNRGVVNVGAVAELADGLMEVVFDASAPVATLLAMKDRQDYSMVHSINVAMMASCQAAALGMSQDQAQQISMAGLLHDIGKTKVPESIVTKTSALTAQEAELMASHSVEGARILMESKGMTGVVPLVAFGHHRLDGDRNILATELVRIADTFDSIRTLRPFDDEEGMRGAVSYMIHFMRNRFNSFLLERFGTICRLFKPGDVRHLTTGELARVVVVHPELSLRPTVEVLKPGKGGATAGAVIDLTNPPVGVQPSLMVPPIPGVFEGLEPAEIDQLG